jgi:hypothetical protein
MNPNLSDNYQAKMSLGVIGNRLNPFILFWAFQPFLRNLDRSLPYPALKRRAIFGHPFGTAEANFKSH